MRVTVLGDPAGNARLEAAGVTVRVNTRPDPDDVVLVAVSVRAGLTPAHLDALDRADGCAVRRLAVFVTEVEHDPAGELVELTGIEAESWLGGAGVVAFPSGSTVPVLRSDDSDLAGSLARIAATDPPLRLSKPDRTPDW